MGLSTISCANLSSKIARFIGVGVLLSSILSPYLWGAAADLVPTLDRADDAVLTPIHSGSRKPGRSSAGKRTAHHCSPHPEQLIGGTG